MSVKHFTVENFDHEVLENGQVSLVDFWAGWCGPCRMMAPVIDELADELDGSAVVGKVEIDEQPDLATRYGIMSIPTVVAFRDGKEIGRTVGVQPKAALLKLIGR